MMSRHVVRTVLMIIVFVGASTTLVFAQLNNPASTDAWCEAPTLVPAAALIDGDMAAANGVTVARGGFATTTRNGPAIRLPEGGARVQISLGERLFNTQWLIADADPGDAVRVDLEPIRGDRTIPVVEVNGSLQRTDTDGGRSIETAARTGAGQQAQITIRTATEEALLTNDGAGPIDVLGVVGCSAITASVETVNAPEWNPGTQRFSASYEVVVENNLVSDRTQGFLALGRGSSPTTIDGFEIDIDVREAGYRTAVVDKIEMPRRFRDNANPAFDGFDDVRTLSSRQVVSNGDPLVITIDVSYEPDFEDSAWDEPTAAPSPKVRASGSVDGVAVSASASRGSEAAAQSESNAGLSTVSAPRPELGLTHRYAIAPSLASDGTVRTTEYLTLGNPGETQLFGATLTYDLIDLFGDGMWPQSIDAKVLAGSASVCEINERFDGDARTRLLATTGAIPVGERCIIELTTAVFPGEVPSSSSTSYDALLVASARSGTRGVEASASLGFSIASHASASAALVDTVATNRSDGSYAISGVLEIENTGALDLSRVTARLDITAPGAEGIEPREVSFTNFSSSGDCEAAAPPRRSTTGAALLPGGVVLPSSSICQLDWEFVAWPGTVLSDWTVTAGASAVTPRGRELAIDSAIASLDLVEQPELGIEVSVRDQQATVEGNYNVTIDTTVSNSGDSPMTSLEVATGLETAFGDRLISSRALVDGCQGVDGRRPLWPSEVAANSSDAERPSSCTVSSIATVRPGALLSNWAVEASVIGVSSGGEQIDAKTTLELTPFQEAPALQSELAVTQFEKIDNKTYRAVLLGTLTNTGDVTLFGVDSTLQFDRIFGSVPVQVEWTSSESLTMNADFDGRGEALLFEGDGTLVAGASTSFRVALLADVGGQREPIDFLMSPSAVSPALRIVRSEPAVATATVPLIQTSKRPTMISNNGDGTYGILSIVQVRNSGEAPLERVEVSSDLLWTLRNVELGDAVINNGCADGGLAPGSFCEYSVSTTVRPGAEVGPYDIAVSVSAVDDNGVSATRIAEPVANFLRVEVTEPVAFQEQPEIEVVSTRSDPVNNNDGTYTVKFATAVKNIGDVPMYRIDLVDGPTNSFAGMLVVNDRTSFGCTSTSFRLPLRPGDTCRETSTVVVRPGSALGPWEIAYEVIATSPSSAQISMRDDVESFVFDETLDLASSSTLLSTANNGDGSYEVAYRVDITNESDVPLIAMTVDQDVAALFGPDRVTGYTLSEDSCNGISTQWPLVPAASCAIHVQLRVEPGVELGPWSVPATIHAESPSGEFALDEILTEDLTLEEAPAIEASTRIESVENVGDGSFRVVLDLNLSNTGDVLVNDVNMTLDLDEAFSGVDYQIDGVISRQLEIEPGFALQETNRLLLAEQSFWVGREATVTLVLNVSPGDAVGPFTSDLTATGTSPANADVTNVIDAAVDLPAIEVLIIDQGVESNRDGTYVVSTTYRVENRGTTVLENLRLVEDLGEIYQGLSAQLTSVTSPDVETVEIVDRRSDFELVRFEEGLGKGETATISSTVLVTPGNALGPFQSTGRAVGISPAGTIVTSTAAWDAPIVFVEQPALRVEQRLVNRPVWNPSGRFDVTFAIDVYNDGDVELRSLQVREDLLHALGWNSSIIVRDVRSETLAANFPGYDGLGRAPQSEIVDEVGDAIGATDEPIVEEVDEVLDDADLEPEEAAEPEQVDDYGDTRLLQGWDTLPAGSTATIEIDLTVTPETRGIYNTRVNVSARTPGGAGLGSDELIAATTITRLTVQGELGVAKQVLGEPFVRPDGSVAVTYEILVANVGPFPLTNVEVHDQLSKAFGLTSSYVTSRVRTEPDSACAGATSSSFDGGAIDPVLVSGVTLQPEQSCRIEYDAFVRPSIPLPGPFKSSAFAIASDPFAGTVIDDSTDGTDPDPDGNQEPGDNDVATEFELELPLPVVSLSVEPIGTEASSNIGWFDTTYEVTAINSGAVDVVLEGIELDLDELWDHSFEVLDVESSAFPLESEFDGARRTNLVTSRTVLPAAETATLRVVVAVERPESGEAAAVATLRGQSAVDRGRFIVESDIAASQIDFPESEAKESSRFFGELSQEESRMLALGGAAFAIIGLVFIIRVIRKMLAFRASRNRKRAYKQVVVDLRESDMIDLRGVDEQERPQRRTRAGSRRRRRGGSHRDDEASSRQRATRP